MTEVERQARALTDQLLADLHSGRRQKIDLAEIERAAAEIVTPAIDPALYRGLVNWTVKFVIERTAPAVARPAQEFDCVECGWHIVVIAGPPSEFHLCAACLTIPGWFNCPEIAATLDPDGGKRD